VVALWGCLRGAFMPPRVSALLTRGGSHIREWQLAPSPCGPMEAPLTHTGSRIARHQQCIPIPLHSMTKQVCATRSISLDTTDILTILQLVWHSLLGLALPIFVNFVVLSFAQFVLDLFVHLSRVFSVSLCWYLHYAEPCFLGCGTLNLDWYRPTS